MAEFLANTWQQRPLHIERDDPSFYPPVFSAAVLDEYLFSSPDAEVLVVPPPGSDREQQKTAPRWATMDRFYARFSKGDSLVLNAAHQHWPPLRRLCAALGRELSVDARVNVYVTPGRSTCFKPHHDLHDVLVLQLEGRKAWKVFEPQIELPIQLRVPKAYKHQDAPFELDVEAVGDPALELEMKPGDLLYMPRGWPHCATGLDSTSVHATIGLHGFYWHHLLEYALELLTIEDPRFRRALPPGALERPADLTATFAELLSALAEKGDLAGALDLARQKHLKRRPMGPDGHFLALGSCSDLTQETRVRRRVGLITSVQVDEQHAYIYFGHNHLRSPRWVEPGLRFIGDNPTFAVGELPDALSANSKVVLVRRLIREGLLRVEAP